MTRRLEVACKERRNGSTAGIGRVTRGRRGIVIATVAVLMLSACTEEPRSDSDDTRDLIEMTALPSDALTECRKNELVSAACPGRIPSVEDAAAGRGQLVKVRAGVGFFDFEAGSHRDGLGSENRPSASGHVTVQAGALDKFLQFAWPKPADRPSDAPAEKRRKAIFIDEVEWNGTQGELVLAPTYPHGGRNGDHLMFRWTSRGTDYLLSLHAWDDLQETEQILERMFASTSLGGS